MVRFDGFDWSPVVSVVAEVAQHGLDDRLAACGTALGLAASLVLTRFLSGVLYGVTGAP